MKNFLYDMHSVPLWTWRQRLLKPLEMKAVVGLRKKDCKTLECDVKFHHMMKHIV